MTIPTSIHRRPVSKHLRDAQRFEWVVTWQPRPGILDTKTFPDDQEERARLFAEEHGFGMES